MNLKFTKMHGAGNDFVVIDAIHQAIELTAEQCRYLADRRFGIGADQILVVEKSDDAAIDFKYRIFNADGGEVEQCGNGARAFVRFVTDKRLTTKSSIKVATLSGIIEPMLCADGSITVDMGKPSFEPAALPFDTAGLDAKQEAAGILWPLEIGAHLHWISVVSMGNPHAVQFVTAVDMTNVAAEGALIENHPRFAKRVNAGFAELIDRHTIRLRVFERGAGETLACGTGACAAVVAGIRRGKLDTPVHVDMPGGRLTISWEGNDKPVFLSGPAVSVFEGEISI